MNVQESLKAIRLQSLLSQADFAKAIGVSFTTVNRWENGKSRPNYKALQAIESFCDKKGINTSVKELWRIVEDEIH